MDEDKVIVGEIYMGTKQDERGRRLFYEVLNKVRHERFPACVYSPTGEFMRTDIIDIGEITIPSKEALGQVRGSSDLGEILTQRDEEAL